MTDIPAGSLATLLAMNDSVADPVVSVSTSCPTFVPSVHAATVTLPSASDVNVEAALPPPESFAKVVLPRPALMTSCRLRD
jgi:hypothetical protein